MVNPIIFVGGVFLAILTYFALCIRMYNNKRLQMIDWFLLSLATFTGLGFAFIYITTSRGLNSLFWQQYINMYDNSTAIIYLLSSVLLGLSSLFGWIFIKSVKNRNAIEKLKYNLNDIKFNRYIKKIRHLAWILLIIAITSYALYSNVYGGFIGLLNHSIAIRSGTVTIYNPFSFLRNFGSFSFFSSFIFFGLLIDKSVDKRNRKCCLLGYIMALGFSIYVLYSLAGRVSALIFITTFILGYILYNYKSIVKLIKGLALLAIILPASLIGIDRILGRSNQSIGMIKLFVKELSFPFASYIVQFGQHNYRLFKDVFVAPLFILPQRIWSGILNIEVASSYNTYIFYGARKGEAGVTGSIPVDMLTFANMQASVIGVVIVGLLWGGLLYFLENLCGRIPLNGVRQLIYANLVLNVALLSVLYGDPQHIVIRNFAMIIGITSLMIYLKCKLSKVVKREKVTDDI